MRSFKPVIAVLMFLFFSLSTFCQGIRGQDLVITVQLNSELYGKDQNEKNKKFKSPSINTIGYNKFYLSEMRSATYLRGEGIIGQDYTEEGIIFKIRDATGSLFKETKDTILNEYSIFYMIDPTDEDLKDDISANPKWKKITITPTDINYLDDGYFAINNDSTKKLTENQIFTIFFRTSESNYYYIAVKQHKQLIGNIGIWSFWAGATFWDIIDFPSLTFTNVSAIIRGETTALFGIVPFGTVNVTLYKYRFIDPNWTFPIISFFGCIDLTTVGGLRGSQIGGTAGNFVSLDSFLSSIGFGTLVGIGTPIGTFYGGYGWRLNSSQMVVTIDHGFIVGANIFNLIDLIGKNLQSQQASI